MHSNIFLYIVWLCLLATCFHLVVIANGNCATFVNEVQSIMSLIYIICFAILALKNALRLVSKWYS